MGNIPRNFFTGVTVSGLSGRWVTSIPLKISSDGDPLASTPELIIPRVFILPRRRAVLCVPQHKTSLHPRLPLHSEKPPVLGNITPIQNTTTLRQPEGAGNLVLGNRHGCGILISMPSGKFKHEEPDGSVGGEACGRCGASWNARLPSVYRLPTAD